MASRAFIFLSKRAPWVRTWVSRGRFVFVLHAGGIAGKCARMSVAGPVLIVVVVFGTGPGSPASPLLTAAAEGDKKVIRYVMLLLVRSMFNLLIYIFAIVCLIMFLHGEFLLDESSRT